MGHESDPSNRCGQRMPSVHQEMGMAQVLAPKYPQVIRPFLAPFTIRFGGIILTHTPMIPSEKS